MNRNRNPGSDGRRTARPRPSRSGGGGGGGESGSRGNGRRRGLSRWRLLAGVSLAGVMLAFGLFALALIQPAPPAHAGHAEGWTDDPNLINVSTIAQLNAIRWDPDGDGAPTSFDDNGNYDSTLQIHYWNAFGGWEKAFAAILESGHASAVHNCPDGCKGYELTQDLTLTGVHENWKPIVSYSGVFDGNGHVITTLHVLRLFEGDGGVLPPNNRVSGPNVWHYGMFRVLEKGGQVKNLGIVDADVQGLNVFPNDGSDQSTGVIAGTNHGTIENVFVVGKVSGQVGVGGIAGRSDGTIRNSWADVTVQGVGEVGGLVGEKSGGEIHSTHSRGSVTGASNVGGLVGALTGGGKVEDSYTIAETSSGFVLRGNNSGGTVTTSYDLVNTAKAALKGSTSFGSGIYATWDRNVWHLGHGLEYPALRIDFDGDGNATVNEFGHYSAPQREVELDPSDPTTDPKYHERLIDIDSIEKLNAIRLDLDGDGGPTSFTDDGVYDSTLQIDYWNAFGGWEKALAAINDSGTARALHNCPGGCIGYELTKDLDLSGHALSAGVGWDPIGGNFNPASRSYSAYNGVFEGNGNTISNLYINRAGAERDSIRVGLFGTLGADAFVRGVGLGDVNITAIQSFGGLAGVSAGTIRESYVTGTFQTGVLPGHKYHNTNHPPRNIGGLVGRLTDGGLIERSWANVTAHGTPPRPPDSIDIDRRVFDRSSDIGGLAGQMVGAQIKSSYATGEISGSRNVGGLVGGAFHGNAHDIIDSYAWARVSAHGSNGHETGGGLVGAVAVVNSFLIASSYFDSSVQPGVNAVGNAADRDGASGKTTAQLTAPTGNDGIYSYWDTGDWDFRDTGQYPLLKVDFNGDGRATSKEFHQDHPGAPSGTIPYFADRTVYDRPADYGVLSNNPLLWLKDANIIPLTLPAATGGDGTVTYSISPALIPGVTFNPETRVISGTPTLVLGTARTLTTYEHVRQYTLTATDEHGDFDAINFCIAYYDDGEHFSNYLRLFGDHYWKVPDALAECNSERSNIRGVAGGGGPKFNFGDTPLLVKDWLGGPFSQTLPEATGGNGDLIYDLTVSATPNRNPRHSPIGDWATGTTFDPTTRILGGQPSITDTPSTLTELEPKHLVYHFTYTVTDERGLQDEMWFCVDLFTDYDYWRSAGFTAIPGCSQSGDLSLGDRWVLDTGLGSAGGDRATVAKYVTNALGQIVQELRFIDEVPAVEFTHQADVGTFRLPAATGGTPGARTYSLNPTTLPAGLSYDPVARSITGTPTELQAPQEYTYTVSDTGGLFAQLTFTISVVEDVEPTFGTATAAGQTWTLNADIGTVALPEATGGNGTLTYKVEPDLPPGVAFDAGARTLSGAPTAPQAETSYTYTATDRDGDEVSLTFTIAIADLVVVPSLSFGDAQLGDYRWHQNVHNGRVDLPAATDGAAPLTYSVTPDLPAGLVFDADARTIDGIPTAAQDRVQYAYTVTDANGATVSLSFSIVVVADAAPSFGEQTIANQLYGKYDNVGTVTLPAATGGNDVLTYTLTPDLPAGLSFDGAARAITGAPTEALAETEYTYTATDFGGDTASLTFTIQVKGMGITMSVADQVTVREGEAFTYHVSLDAQPAANTVVEVTSDNGDVGLAPASLTFTADNWQTAQAVTVSAGEDPNGVDDEAVVSHSIGGETVASFNVKVTDDDSDREILRDFYDATGGDNWTNNDGWLSDKGLRHWHGVTTDDRGQVTQLVLDGNNLTGSLPAELGKLESLTRLALNRNGLTGSIPTELGSLPNLGIIGLARNSLSGSVPDELGNLTGLTRLSLHDNTALSGALPDGFTGLANLQRLAIANTGLCLPDTQAFDDWLAGVPDKPGIDGLADCASP